MRDLAVGLTVAILATSCSRGDDSAAIDTKACDDLDAVIADVSTLDAMNVFGQIDAGSSLPTDELEELDASLVDHAQTLARSASEELSATALLASDISGYLTNIATAGPAGDESAFLAQTEQLVARIQLTDTTAISRSMADECAVVDPSLSRFAVSASTWLDIVRSDSPSAAVDGSDTTGQPAAPTPTPEQPVVLVDDLGSKTAYADVEFTIGRITVAPDAPGLATTGLLVSVDTSNTGLDRQSIAAEHFFLVDPEGRRTAGGTVIGPDSGQSSSFEVPAGASVRGDIAFALDDGLQDFTLEIRQPGKVPAVLALNGTQDTTYEAYPVALDPLPNDAVRAVDPNAAGSCEFEYDVRVIAATADVDLMAQFGTERAPEDRRFLSIDVELTNVTDPESNCQFPAFTNQLSIAFEVDGSQTRSLTRHVDENRLPIGETLVRSETFEIPTSADSLVVVAGATGTALDLGAIELPRLPGE